MPLCLFCSHVLSAPNVLRVGTTENIFVECQDCAQNMTVSIKVLNFPTKTPTLASTSVNLNRGNNYQALGKLKVKITFVAKPTVLCSVSLIFNLFLWDRCIVSKLTSGVHVTVIVWSMNWWLLPKNCWGRLRSSMAVAYCTSDNKSPSCWWMSWNQWCLWVELHPGVDTLWLWYSSCHWHSQLSFLTYPTEMFKPKPLRNSLFWPHVIYVLICCHESSEVCY